MFFICHTQDFHKTVSRHSCDADLEGTDRDLTLDESNSLLEKGSWVSPSKILQSSRPESTQMLTTHCWVPLRGASLSWVG